MNNQRRKEITKCMNEVERIIKKIGEICFDESDAWGNLPVSFQNGEQGESMTECILAMEWAMESLEEASFHLDSAMA